MQPGFVAVTRKDWDGFLWEEEVGGEREKEKKIIAKRTPGSRNRYRPNECAVRGWDRQKLNWKKHTEMEGNPWKSMFNHWWQFRQTNKKPKRLFSLSNIRISNKTARVHLLLNNTASASNHIKEIKQFKTYTNVTYVSNIYMCLAVPTPSISTKQLCRNHLTVAKDSASRQSNFKSHTPHLVQSRTMAAVAARRSTRSTRYSKSYWRLYCESFERLVIWECSKRSFKFETFWPRMFSFFRGIVSLVIVVAGQFSPLQVVWQMRVFGLDWYSWARLTEIAPEKGGRKQTPLLTVLCVTKKQRNKQTNERMKRSTCPSLATLKRERPTESTIIRILSRAMARPAIISWSNNRGRTRALESNH